MRGLAQLREGMNRGKGESKMARMEGSSKMTSSHARGPAVAVEMDIDAMLGVHTLMMLAGVRS